ncbi:hypothetical protein PT974_02671 [Cladobotryum mycophilum]|uniref:Gastric mucin-like protein n=1 Tax=Cladobotryum mycophilum TaxID=491253 RepID=A0ABR0SYR1_9HYPO
MIDTKMENNGSVVAFEGHPDLISTQLRLLPTSPQILILPAVQCYITNDEDQAFEVRRYIRKVHDALTARNETARKFLQDSTSSGKRLALCIKAIMKHETGGDRAEAEVFFNQLVKDGLTGLENDGKCEEILGSSGYDDNEDLDDELQDPITRAMRAADALDRETANLQPIDMLDLTLTTRPRSLSLPLYGYSDGFGDAAPFFLFGAHYEDESDPEAEAGPEPTSAEAPTFSLIDYNQPTKRARGDSVDWAPTSPNCIGESYTPFTLRRRRDTEILSPTSDVFTIRTSEHVVYGEAAILDMRVSISIPKGPLARIKSLDRICPINPKFRDLYVPTAEVAIETSVPRRPHSFMVITDEKNPAARRLSHIDRPRTILVRPKRPTIKVDPVPFGKKGSQNPVRISYVDRGTDAAEATPVEPQFQAVLPCLEDLVVYFKDETPDSLLYSVVRSFKAGNYPVVPQSEASFVIETSFSSPSTPLDQQTPAIVSSSVSKASTMLNTAADDEYDPFAYGQSTWLDSKKEQPIPTVNIIRPPTPAQTPPPYCTKDDKFHEFDIVCGQTAVTMQNSLRSILNIYFPPEGEGYRQFQFSLLPEFDGLWKPVFRESDSKSSQRENNRRVDQILAIGSQQGVKKEYSSGIIKQLEKHGTKSSDEQGRSGRVDFRYLLANAMQSFTAQPLANQTSNNPFTNSYLLATLIIPHLETYLALHSEIRYLLLEYPPEHLPTVLALQKLVGVDLIKVAQIVDSANKDRLPFTQIGGPSVGNKSENKTPTLSPRSSSSDITVSNANFLLTSTATEAEIAKFISTVWNIQAEASDSDVSDRFPHGKVLRKKKTRPTPLNSAFIPFPRSSMSSQGGLSPTSCATSDPVSPTLASSRRSSWIEKPKSPKHDGGVSKHTRLFSRRKLPRGGEISPVNNYDPSEDSDLELEERRLMPMFMQKPSERKGNTRKALKFLGLA